MNSIDNLRKYVYDVLTKSMAYAINDLIDEVEREVKELTDERDLLKTQWEAGVDFDQRLEACADKREDVTLFGVDYMAYPLDADGVPWHINDEFEVDEGIAHVNGIGDNRLFYIDGDGMQWTRADNKRHHHAPTVEDMLADVADKAASLTGSYIEDGMNGDEYMDSMRSLVAEYAARLRLAGEE